MKLVSWNTNGVRATFNQGYWKPFIDTFHDADIIGIQEIKAEEEQLPEEVQQVSGYHSFFSSSQTRKGYSGVALYTKQKPDSVLYDFGTNDLEGRTIIAFFDKTMVCNIYFPNGGGAPDRLEYKLNFYDAFLSFIDKYKNEGYKIIVMGDVNVAHEEIDIARPKENENHVGFLPIEREWFDEVIRHGFVDTFRHLHPTQKECYSYWDMKTRARERNVGWRIDYFLISQGLLPSLVSAKIHTDIAGSDHCPISLTLK